jgi:hypothetical protein
MRETHSSHLIRLQFGHSNNILWGTKIMALLIMQFSPPICYFISTLFWSSLSECSSLYVRDQVSNPHSLFHCHSDIHILHFLLLMFSSEFAGRSTGCVLDIPWFWTAVSLQHRRLGFINSKIK